ncbi:MAG: type IV secretory system conjugative DNA transfer family protein [Pseudobdellovibrionaceae bacterium]|jgi:conjugal transfer pilus assembly protein TraD
MIPFPTKKTFDPKEVIQIGKIKNKPFFKESLTEGQLNHHVHVVGASGYGKTVLLSHIIKQRIQQKKGLMFIDLKGDMETLMAFSKLAIDAGRAEDLQIFSLSEQEQSIPYNFLEDGTANQLRDRIMSSLIWSEEYYKNQSASYLLKLLMVLVWFRDHRGQVLNLTSLLNGVSDKSYLEGVLSEIPEEFEVIKKAGYECTVFLRENDNYKSLQGLRTQIESLVLSDFGKLISANQKGINLFDTVTNGKIIFFFLDSRRYGETAKAVGKFILQDLKSVSARVDAEIPKADRRPFTVVIDEFADLAQEDFIGFLDRARSSKMSVVVAHQEICDLQRISPEFAGRLMGNTSTLYAFLQKRPESAEIISGMAGTKTVWKTTKQTERLGFFDIESGGGSKREVEEFIIHPNMIKTLQVGKCVCIKKYPESRAYLVEVALD